MRSETQAGILAHDEAVRQTNAAHLKKGNYFVVTLIQSTEVLHDLGKGLGLNPHHTECSFKVLYLQREISP